MQLINKSLLHFIKSVFIRRIGLLLVIEYLRAAKFSTAFFGVVDAVLSTFTNSIVHLILEIIKIFVIFAEKLFSNSSVNMVSL